MSKTILYTTKRAARSVSLSTRITPPHMEKCRARFRSDRFLKAGLIALLALILCGAAIGAAGATELIKYNDKTFTDQSGNTYIINGVIDGIKSPFTSENTVSYSNGVLTLKEGAVVDLENTLEILVPVDATTKEPKFTIDLNGGVIQRASNATGNFSLITINSGNGLKLQDKTAVKHYFMYHSSAAWTWISEPTEDQIAAAKPISAFDRSTAEDGGSVFYVEGGVITGGSADDGGGVTSKVHSMFIMSGGSIAGNSADGYGGGVYSERGTFAMSGTASIIGNSADGYGGGVDVNLGSEFTMSGTASIIGNSASDKGGGVNVVGMTKFTMSGGSITGNSADEGGGGVYVNDTGVFTMSVGSIIGNSTGATGGGVAVNNNGKFTMSGGSIVGNSADEGGGVSVKEEGTFTMSGGSIARNYADGKGGGVYVDLSSEFTMFGNASITENSAILGGGVDVEVKGTFTMSGGFITGNSAEVGGGVNVNENGTFNVSSGPVIKDNTFLDDETVDNNVYLGSTECLHLAGPLAWKKENNVVTPLADIRITSVADTPPTKDEAFGTANGSFAGAGLISNDIQQSSDKPTLWGYIDTNESNMLKWGEDEPDVPLSFVAGIGGTEYTSVAAAVSEANNGDTITMINDSLEPTVVIYKQITLDLNGHVLQNDGNGSVIEIASGGDLILKDDSNEKIGTVTGGNTISGGGVLVKTGGEFTMEGGNITGNSAIESGGGVYVHEGGTFNVSGAPVIKNNTMGSNANNVYLNEATITVAAPLTPGADIRIADASPDGVIATDNTSSSSTNYFYFYPDNAYVISKFDSGNKKIKWMTIDTGWWNGAGDDAVFKPAEDGYTTAAAFANAINESSKSTGPHNGTVSVSKKTATLKKDIKLGGTLKIGGTVADSFILDLGGHVLSAAASEFSVITVPNNSFLTLADTHENTNIHYFQIAEKNGDKWTKLKSPWVLTDTPSEEELTNHTIALEKIDSYDGEHGWAKQDNNDEYVYHYVKVTGGVITGGNKKYGDGAGGVDVDGTFTMSSGSIAGNCTTRYSGGGVRVTSSSGTFEMSGGIIAGNYAGDKGGGVDGGSSTFTMSGDARIIGNSAGRCGGVFVGGKFEMSGGSIAGNSAKNDGGGVLVYDGGTFEMKGGCITGNNATDDSGGGVLVNGMFEMSGGCITENSTNNYYGGGVAVYGGTFEMKGGEIKENSANGGGGVYVWGGEFKVSGTPVIKGNTKKMEENGTTANNVYLAGTDDDAGEQAFITVTGDLFGEIYVNKPVAAGGKFGTGEQKYGGAANFVSDNVDNEKHYVGEWQSQSNELHTLAWGTETKPLYLITITESPNGTAVSSVSSEAAAGAYIKLTATPDEGYEFEKWTVTGAEVSSVTDNPATFIMPASDVTVSATFKNSEPAVTYTVTFDSAGGSAVSPQEVAEGECASKPADPAKDGYTFAKWLTENGTEYNFSTPVYSDITLTAKWNTKAPETEEEAEALLQELRTNPDKEVTIAVTAANLDAVKYLLKRAAGEGLGNRILIDPTAGDIDAVKTLIREAKDGGYSPVCLETSPDTIEMIKAILSNGNIPKEDIALPIKADGSNIRVILEIISGYAPVEIKVPIPDMVRIPEGTEIEPTTAAADIIKELLEKAQNTATADNLHLILTDANIEAVRQIAEKLPGVIVKVTSDNHAAIRKLIEAGAVITLTVENEEDAAFIKELAEMYPDKKIIVEVTSYNKDIITGLLKNGTALSLKAAENGSNIETILEMEDEFPGLVSVHTPDRIILSDDVEMKINGSNKETLRKILIAATLGDSAGKVILDLGSEETNLLIAAELLGDKEINGSAVTIDGRKLDILFKLVPSKGETAELNYGLEVRESSKEYLNSIKLLDAENTLSILATAMGDHILGGDTKIPQDVPASIGYTSQEIYTVFQTYGTADDEGKPVTLRFEVASNEGYGGGTENYYLKYFNPETNTWERTHITMTGSPVKVEGKDNTWIYTFAIDKPGVYAFVYETKVKNSSSGEGSSVWGTETAEPTATPTPTSTAQPTTEVPTVKPTASPTETPKSPMAIAGILAGLGAAACLLAARRK